MQHGGYPSDTYELTDDRSGTWVRVLQADGTEQAAMLAIGPFTIHLDRLGAGPLVGDHSENTPSDAHELLGLARHMNADPDALLGCTAVARVTEGLR